MPKVLVRVLDNIENSLWDNDHQKELLRQRLNDDGFYVISGKNDCLEVYAIKYKEWYQ